MADQSQSARANRQTSSDESTASVFSPDPNSPLTMRSAMINEVLTATQALAARTPVQPSEVPDMWLETLRRANITPIRHPSAPQTTHDAHDLLGWTPVPKEGITRSWCKDTCRMIDDVLCHPDIKASPEQTRLIRKIQDLLREPVTESSLQKAFKDSMQNLNGYLAMRRRMEPLHRELQEQLPDLMKLQLYARYGDYLASACRDMEKLAKTHANANDSNGSEIQGPKFLSTGERFSQVWVELMEERDAHHIPREKKLSDSDVSELFKLPAHNGFFTAAMAAGINRKDALFAVEQYWTRNTLVHAGLDELVNKLRWSEFGDRLEADIKLIPRIISDPREISFLTAMVELCRDKWLAPKPVNHQETAWQPWPSITALTQSGIDWTEEHLKEMSMMRYATNEQIAEKIEEIKRDLERDAVMRQKQAAFDPEAKAAKREADAEKQRKTMMGMKERMERSEALNRDYEKSERETQLKLHRSEMDKEKMRAEMERSDGMVKSLEESERTTNIELCRLGMQNGELREENQRFREENEQQRVVIEQLRVEMERMNNGKQRRSRGVRRGR